MGSPGLSTQTIVEELVDANGRSLEDTAAEVGRTLARSRACLVRNFPTEPDAYLGFLGHFGEPLPNYSSRSDLDADAPRPQINRVRYKRKGQYTTHSVHYVAGELRPHSARSWRAPRPAYFAMLMVDPGWRDSPEGQRGESVVLRWEHLLTRLAERDGEVFGEHFARLSGTPLRFQANNVREELADLPLCYPLPDATSRYDVGVRLKQDLLDKLPGIADQFPDPETYRRSLEYLVRAAADPAHQVCFPMQAGDLLLIDNNRFGHGRRTVVGEHGTGDSAAVNPRELWSVTVA
ncbi:MAG TPA: TauD/TfdA family dioxygenase [Mycobacteriales bacterium]|nr:TauD/TfdA family dioxygenase [Mycobacteriales bacterium]